ncbi:MAG: ADP-forming succinate--CoA ligase subunit beta [Gammaproteobacteria bacterium]|nr:ADP-forming succinate--CoA ligase subunit beta [Gammaproteobacteria bacterium]
MNIHEYQAKAIFSRFGVPVLDSHLVRPGDDVEQFCESLESHAWVVKAQVHAGGRGKAGGVIRADSRQDLASAVSGMLGARLVTRQTGEEGLPVQAVLLEAAVQIRRELYLALLVDREAGQVAIIASAAGGMDIEQVAQQAPDKIIAQHVHPAAGLQPSQVRTLAYALGLQKDQVRQLQAILFALFEMFISSDCSLVEINPLIIDGDDRLVALDAKINIDDNALYRQADIAKLRDATQGNRDEERACELGLNYVQLDGRIGCIVNGAGLAMATMDLVKHQGGEPANFLDVGGAITQEKVAEAFKLVVHDARVKAVLVNIFGGIVRCDLIARGILDALQSVSLKVPVIVLLQGTRAAEGRKLLENRDAGLHQADTLTEAAQRAIRLART